jgi:3-hydroxybutyryl-CoA dehydrogenase
LSAPEVNASPIRIDRSQSIGRSAGNAVVGVVGAGTMGSGIAQVAATAGHPVRLYDAVPGAAERATATILSRVRKLADTGRLAVDAQRLQISAVGSLAELAGAAIVVEAVVEDLAVKQGLFADLEAVVRPQCVLASNTSSLSPAAIGARLKYPERVVGLHFFNPVPSMPLVEVVPGPATDDKIVRRVGALAGAWGKTVVRSAATPGFIVNRVARPFYAEAWRVYEEGAAEPAVIDAVITGAGGFPLGPFALMDLIGHDVNEAVTRSVWTGFGHDPRFAPSLAQRQLVEAGRLGRKSGCGIYDYAEGGQAPAPVPASECNAPGEVGEQGDSGLRALLRRADVAVGNSGGPDGAVTLPGGALMCRSLGRPAASVASDLGSPVVIVDRTLDDEAASAIAIAASDGCSHDQRAEAIGLLQAAGLSVYVIDDAPGLILTRTVAMLVNTAVDALHRGVASAADIDTAMCLGTRYPLGPLAWGERWTLPTVLAILDGLHSTEGDPHYRASTLLRRRAIAERLM